MRNTPRASRAPGRPLSAPSSTVARPAARARAGSVASPPVVPTYSNPLSAANSPDPAILRVGGLYYLACTSGNAPDAFPLRVSDDLVRWRRAGSIFPRERRPAWTKSDFWAPEIHRIGRRFVAYYTARDHSGRLCVGAASSDSPLGPWSDLGRPLVRDDRVGMIDAHQFRERTGRRFLYWKKDGNDLRPMERTDIYAQELGPDGLSLTGPRHVVLANDRGWEGDLVEGPWVVQRGAYYYLFYSGNNFWTEHYAVGIARARSPFGPFVKHSETLLRRDENWLGPGHGCVVHAHDGHDYFVYHAWQRGRVGGRNPRMLLLDRIQWENGWPRINDGSPSALPQPRP